MSLDNAFSCYLMSQLTLNVFVLRIYRRIFALCHYFLFFSTFGVISVKTGRNGVPVKCKLLFVVVLGLTNGFLVLILRIFKKHFLYSVINAHFIGSVCCRIITLLTGPLKEFSLGRIHSVEKRHN